MVGAVGGGATAPGMIGEEAGTGVPGATIGAVASFNLGRSFGLGKSIVDGENLPCLSSMNCMRLAVISWS